MAAYRNGTYVAFNGMGTTDPALLRDHSEATGVAIPSRGNRFKMVAQ